MASLPSHVSTAGLAAEFGATPRDERLLAEGAVGVAVTRAFTRLRIDAGVSRAELARRVGRDEDYVVKLESGGYERCTVPALGSFARALGYDVDVQAMLSRTDAVIYSKDVGVEPVLDYELRSADDERAFYVEGSGPVGDFVDVAPRYGEVTEATTAPAKASETFQTSAVYTVLGLGALAATALFGDAAKSRSREKV